LDGGELMEEQTAGETIPEVSVSNTQEPTGGLLGTQQPEPVQQTTQEAIDTGSSQVAEPSIYGDLEVQWPESLEPEFRNEPILKPYVDPEGNFNINGAIKSLVHAQKNIGRDRVIIPTDESPPEDWLAFHEKAFGYNQDPEQYEIDYNMEEGNLDSEFVQSLVDYGHSNMYPPALLGDMIGYLDEQVAQQEQAGQEAAKQEFEKGVDFLKQQWGAGFDRKVGQAKQVVTDFGDETFQEYLEESGLINDVALAEFIATIGEKLYGEDSFHGENVGNMAGQLTPQEADSEINHVYGDPNHPYHKKDHPQHAQAQEQMLKLFAMKRGERVR
jgi:hypothetical protein